MGEYQTGGNLDNHRKELSVLIHTGEDPLDEANKFSFLFSEYPGAKCILAHGRPLEQTVSLLRCFPNVYCDTAFMPEASLLCIVAEGFAGKILPGSDFPITHYFKWKYGDMRHPPAAWRRQYAEDAKALKTNYETTLKKLNESLKTFPEVLT
jgi:predicted TIM-barrel fold metal-dependent hydrolase